MTQKEYEAIPYGQHFWGIHENAFVKPLVMLAKLEFGLEVCGPWECGTCFKDVTVIALIDFPAGHSKETLYYQAEPDPKTTEDEEENSENEIF